MSHTDRGRRPRRAHHIADIAHHFLGEGAPVASPAWIVAASGPWPWSAPVAVAFARLVAAESGERVRLAEDPDVPWSVAAHLASVPADEVVRVDPSARDAHGDAPLCWHLGPVDGRVLDDLTSARRVPGCRLPGDGRAPVLVWCVGHAEVHGWAPVEPLVRCAALLGPRRVELLAVPDRARPPRRGRRPASPSPEAMEELARRVAEVGPAPAGARVLSGEMTVAARADVLARVHRKAGRETPVICPGPDPLANLA
jgi:hypothetical protein